jgi:hypothetical protein
MYISMSEYLKKSRCSRLSHINLSEPCMEIGHYHNMELRVYLAHELKVMLPDERYQAYVCHACNNEKCSNKHHIYWGTAKDNHLDKVENGTYKTIYEYSVEKYGEEEFRLMCLDYASKGGKAGGGHNKLSKEEITKRTKDVQREPIIRGRIKRLADKWDVSHSQVRRFIKKYVDVNIK